MGQGGLWRPPEPQGALLVTEGLGGHLWVGEACPEVRSDEGCEELLVPRMAPPGVSHGPSGKSSVNLPAAWERGVRWGCGCRQDTQVFL